MGGLAGAPPLGLGCAALGNLYAPVSDGDAAATLDAAMRGGIRRFDTAPYYGHGLSETRLGHFLRAGGGPFHVTTKVGRSLVRGAPGSATGFVDAAPFTPVFDYSADGVRAQVAASFDRLGVASVDALLVHDLGRLVHGSDHCMRLRQALEGAFPALAALKGSGLTRAVGLGVNEVAICLEVLAEVPLDTILLAGRYTLLEQAPLDDLLPLCLARGVEVVIGGPYNSGVLAGDRHYDYGPVPASVAARVAALADACAAFDVPLAAAALQFPLAHPAVTAVIPGARSPAEVADALRFLAWPIPGDLWRRLKADRLIRADAPVPASA